MSATLHRAIPEKILSDINSSSNVALFTHSHPDGDALGSILGLASLLESLGKKVFCLLEEPVSYLYAFLPDQEKLSVSIEEYQDFIAAAGDDVISIALDCGDANRLGVFKNEVLSQSPFWVIDHHQSHVDFGTGRWVDSKASSTGEMVYELGLLLEANVDYNAAFNLYVAMSTDTGFFRYECTGQRTMEIAGQLISKGVRPEEIGGHIYDNFSKERLKLMELVLGSLILLEDDQIAFISVTRKMLSQSGAKLQDVEGFIDLPRSLTTVKVAVLLKESKNGTISVSMRAKGECNVADVAQQFGGGGHRNAAGFSYDGKSLAEVKDKLYNILQNVLSVS